MKVLFVVSGTEQVAATRYRVCQYLPYLNKHGIEYKVISLISNVVTALAIRSPEFNGLKRLGYYIILAIERFIRFWFIFLKVAHYDILFLQRATFPTSLCRILRMRHKKVIFDIDDAIFMPDSPKQNLIVRFKTFVKERELKYTLRMSHSVIVENEYIRKYVSRYCNNVYKIRGPIDTERYFVKEKTNDDADIVLGWIGSPATTAYLHLLDYVFSEILTKFDNVKVVLIGAGNYTFPSRRVVKKKWVYEKEVEELQNFDIGLMPMPDDQWTRGKLGCKMLQYMAVGVPSVVSYTPTNAELIKDGENGFLVKSESEWIERLSMLIGDKGLRKKIGKAGWQTVEELCSIKKNGPELVSIFKNVIENEKTV